MNAGGRDRLVAGVGERRLVGGVVPLARRAGRGWAQMATGIAAASRIRSAGTQDDDADQPPLLIVEKMA